MVRSTNLFARRRGAVAAALLLTTAVSIAVVVRRADAADDIDLLRDEGGQPFVMVLLDTSASMNLQPSSDKNPKQNDLGTWVPANGDDPKSKIYQVKKALYEVFSEVEGIHFGFAGFNQDNLRVKAKHWLYAAQAPATFFSEALTLTYPEAAGDQWVFGTHFDLPTGSPGEVGTCAAPLSYTTDRMRLDRFARLGAGGLGPTTLWILRQGTTYRVTIERADASIPLGSQQIDVQITAEEVDPTTCSPKQTEVRVVTFDLVTDFLMVEANVGNQGVPSPVGSEPLNTDNCSTQETVAGYWDYQDIQAVNTCGAGSSQPFTGRGWEGNTDSGARPAAPFNHENFDPFQLCGGSQLGSPSCDILYNAHFPTTLQPDPAFDELDMGDFIPLDWTVDHREDFLRRLNPRHPNYLPKILWDEDLANGELDDFHPAFRPYFGVATYFQDTPEGAFGDAPDSDDFLKLKNEGQRPLVAFGNSPLGRAINDFRCWVLGVNDTGPGGGKCGNRKGQRGPSYNPGWNTLFQENDIWYKCRLPYLIVISDGEENSDGENPSADVADFLNKAAVRTWVFTFNDKDSDLISIANPGGGDIVLVTSGNELKEELEKVIGEIRQDATTFATAAVPSVQASTDQNIYITHFQPNNQAAIWEGHMRSFPSSSDLDLTNDPHTWDSAIEMLAQAPDRPADGDTSTLSDLKLGTGENERRIYFGMEPTPGVSGQGTWVDHRAGLDEGWNDEETTSDVEPTAESAEADLWSAFGVTYDPDDPDSIQQARSRVYQIIENTVVEKHWDNPDNGPTDYILGEMFHSDPLIVGGPTNTQYFILDAEERTNPDGTTEGTGYQEFFNKHENRRKLVIAGANDGMVHAFDVGRPSIEELPAEPGGGLVKRDEVRFDNGTGLEVFAYIPRSVLPIVAELAENPSAHRWSVDGPPAAGDVFIDPAHGGAPDPDEREWRTVLIGGLREGGSAYYALDITQPDKLDEGTVGPTDEELAEARRDVLLPAGAGVVPECADDSTSGTGDVDCDAVLYPAPLWEFSDRIWDPANLKWVDLDEDPNGLRDLGETWSVPDIGRIRVIQDGETVNKYVAIFGGGLDPFKSGSQGNFLYIVDIENGQTIYKRRLEGSAPSSPAAVDIDQDSFFDRIYIGTTFGFLYRVDLVKEDASGVVLPVLEPVQVRGIDGNMHDQGATVRRIGPGNDADNPLWEPRKIFTTGGRPIYFPPSVLFVANLGEFALGLGTGDRDALTAKTGLDGRFYLFVDETSNIADTNLPLAESNFTVIDKDDTTDRPDLLTDPSIAVGRKGWVLDLADNERLIGNPFGFAGITFFATFETADPTPSCDVTKSNCDNPLCLLDGTSFLYLVGTSDADAFLTVSGNLQRYREIQGFVTNPFTEQSIHSALSGEDDGGDGGEGEEDEDACFDEALVRKLMALFPSQCKFGTHYIDVKLIRSETVGLECLAQVPVCIVEKNWKEIME